jgi:D-amino-acid dehydrogenase
MAMTEGRVIVVGGGVVGLSCAWFLRAAGCEVVVIERGQPGGGASRGNAGAICPSMVEPLPAPGILRDGLAGMTRSDAALHVAPTYAPRLAGFLRRFAQAATRERYDAGVEALLPLGHGVLDAYEELATAGIGRHARSDGYVFACRSWQAAHEEREHIASMAARGLCEEPEEVLDGDDLREVEPVLTHAVGAGFVLPRERWIDPSRLVDELAAGLRAAGAELRTDGPAAGLRETPDGVEVDAPDGPLSGTAAVVAAGVWTRELVAPLGLRLPLYPGKGYSFSVASDPSPDRVLYLPDAHVMATPMDGRLRIAGTMEFDGTTDRFNGRRIDAIVRATAPLVRADLEDRRDEWVGPRPITPDGLPFLGPVPGHERVIVAAGHNMLGVTLAPVTGRVVARLVTTGDAGLDLAPFAPARYGAG